VRSDVLSRLYGHHVDVFHAHGRVIVSVGEEHRKRVASPAPRRRAAPTRHRERRQRLHRRQRYYYRTLSPAPMSVWHAIFQPGFFGNSAVQTAASSGSWSPVFAPRRRVHGYKGPVLCGHAFADITSTGVRRRWSSGQPLGRVRRYGVARGRCHGADRCTAHRGRDLATGIVLGAALGLSALFLYLSVTSGSTTGTVVT